MTRSPKKRSSILKTRFNHPEKELEFELDYQLSLTTSQRFRMMIKRSREIARMLLKNGHLKPFEVIKRT